MTALHSMFSVSVLITIYFFFRAGTSLQNKGQANVVLRCVERLLKNNVTKVRKWLKLLEIVFSLEFLILAFSVHSFFEYLNF